MIIRSISRRLPEVTFFVNKNAKSTSHVVVPEIPFFEFQSRFRNSPIYFGSMHEGKCYILYPSQISTELSDIWLRWSDAPDNIIYVSFIINCDHKLISAHPMPRLSYYLNFVWFSGLFIDRRKRCGEAHVGPPCARSWGAPNYLLMDRWKVHSICTVNRGTQKSEKFISAIINA